MMGLQIILMNYLKKKFNDDRIKIFRNENNLGLQNLLY